MSAQAGFVPNVMTLGTGPRRILALHCTMAFGGAWAGVAKHLGDITTIRAPDLPSHGRSADWDEISDFGQTAFDSTLAALDDAPMDVVGHSFGGMTALRLAIAYPERIRTLTLIEPVFFAVAQQDQPEVMADLDTRAAPFADAIGRGDMAGAARAFNRMWGDGGPGWDTLPESTRAAMTRAIHVVPDTYGLLYDDTAGMLAPGAMDRCTMPTLLMRGQKAHQSIIAVNDGLARRLPNATQYVVEGSGHMAPITHPARVAGALKELFDRAPA
jgi:pimeloyl-ACP methyl ester carboxylesterase